MRRRASCAGLAGCALLLAPCAVAAQPAPDAVASYYRAVGDHFRVPPAELLILSEGRLPPDEIPVVLWVARRGGVSPEAVVALRQDGRGWSEVAGRYALSARDLHVAVDGSAGSLAPVYDAYRARPTAQWAAIALDDGAVVALVNLRVLGDILGASAASLVETRDRTGSWVDAYRALARR